MYPVETCRDIITCRGGETEARRRTLARSKEALEESLLSGDAGRGLSFMPAHLPSHTGFWRDEDSGNGEEEADSNGATEQLNLGLISLSTVRADPP